jgi:LysM repeat protein
VGGRAGAGTGRPTAQRVHVVRSGETLWAIARTIVGPAGDPRPMVDRLIETNHLSGRALDPGRRLILPGG